MENKKRLGRYIRSPVVAGEYYDSYIPKPLLPETPLDMDELYPLLYRANGALGRLDGMNAVFPDSTTSVLAFFPKWCLNLPNHHVNFCQYREEEIETHGCG